MSDRVFTITEVANYADKGTSPITEMLRSATQCLDSENTSGAGLYLHGARLAQAHQELTARETNREARRALNACLALIAALPADLPTNLLTDAESVKSDCLNVIKIIT